MLIWWQGILINPHLTAAEPWMASELPNRGSDRRLHDGAMQRQASSLQRGCSVALPSVFCFFVELCACLSARSNASTSMMEARTRGGFRGGGLQDKSVPFPEGALLGWFERFNRKP